LGKLVSIGAFDYHFGALAMATNGVSQAVRLADRQVPRPEERLHALTHPDSPAVLFLDNIESNHGTPSQNGPQERRTSICAGQPEIIKNKALRRIGGVDLCQPERVFCNFITLRPLSIATTNSCTAANSVAIRSPLAHTNSVNLAIGIALHFAGGPCLLHLP
jgi:hypothetical protein